MTEQHFKPGDVVRLKSGGAAMTVCRPWTDDRIICDWHDNTGAGCQAYYLAEQLDLIQPALITRIAFPQSNSALLYQDTYNREMPPVTPSSQEDMGTKTDGTSRNVATVQTERNDK